MSITEELNNIKSLESAGFDHKQAEALTCIIEKAQVSGREDLKEFIRSENSSLRNEIRNEINNLRNEFKQDIKDLEVRMAYAQKDLLIKIFGIIVGTVGVAVTILKLFP
jgi:hypothetical protein